MLVVSFLVVIYLFENLMKPIPWLAYNVKDFKVKNPGQHDPI